MSHTPGPWRVIGEISRETNGEVIRSNDGTGSPVAFVCDFNRYDRDEERVANAHLITAAPDLLSALRFLMAFYEPGQRYLNTEAWKVAEAQARAAIAKAEGRADLTVARP